MNSESSNQTIVNVYKRLEKIIENKEGRSIQEVGSFIVGATTAEVDLDTELFYSDYPAIIAIEDMGSDLEWQGKQEDYDDEIAKLRVWLETLRKSIKELN